MNPPSPGSPPPSPGSPPPSPGSPPPSPPFISPPPSPPFISPPPSPSSSPSSSPRSFSERVQGLATSAQKSASTLLEGTAYAAGLIGPYIAQFQQLFNIITDIEMTPDQKAEAIITFIKNEAYNQAKQIAGDTFTTSKDKLINLIRQLNTYKKQICSVVVTVKQVQTIFDYITTNPEFIYKLKTELINVNQNDIQNIINNPIELTTLSTPSTTNTDKCERQIDNMLNQLFPGFSRFSRISGGKKYRKNKKTKSKRRLRSKRRKSIRKR
jgi:hypothetical protein